MNLSKKLTELNILNYNGRYNGPLDLVNFKAVIHIPYAWSNLALYEAIFLGIIYFIPSLNFFLELKETGDFFFSPPFDKKYIHYSEWYNEDNKDIFVYFNSWDDLVFKSKYLNFDLFRENIKEFAKLHEKKYLDLWNIYLQ